MYKLFSSYFQLMFALDKVVNYMSSGISTLSCPNQTSTCQVDSCSTLVVVHQIALAFSAFKTCSLPFHPSSCKNSFIIIYQELFVEKVAKDLTSTAMHLELTITL